MNINGSVTLENVLSNAGTVTMTGTGTTCRCITTTTTYFGGIFNLAGGLWDIQTNATIACGYYGQ